MSNEVMKQKVRQALNEELAHIRTTSLERDQLYENAIGGKVMKHKLKTGLVLALVLVLVSAVAVAAVLLSQREIVEQVAVPMAQENDTGVVATQDYSPEQLAHLIQTLNENGFTLEENNTLMQILKSGQGYNEEETIMEICRQAFGGNYGTWTLEQQDWFNSILTDIGYFDEHIPNLPGEGNMTYEQAEAYAFAALKAEFGDSLDPSDRESYILDRGFWRGDEDIPAYWDFTLFPKDIMHGTYSVSFEDEDPDGTLEVDGSAPDWTEPYTADDLVKAFLSINSPYYHEVPASALRQLHDMMADAKMDPDSVWYPDALGFALTGYPEPAENDISREDAIAAAKAALGNPQAVCSSAVLTEYEGKRTWLVTLTVYIRMGTPDEIRVVSVDSASGQAESIREMTRDDSETMVLVAEAAYTKSREGLLTEADYIRLAAEAIRAEHPGLDLLNEEEYETRVFGWDQRTVWFVTRNLQHGNVSASVSRDGKVSDITVDSEGVNPDNLYSRYWSIYGWYSVDNGEWDAWNQDVWAQLKLTMDPLEPTTVEAKLLKMGQYPTEDSVRIDHRRAQELALQQVNHRWAEVNTCILIDAQPHPVWKIRVIADSAADAVFELDAETGEILNVDLYRTEYTPDYVLYSLEKNCRKVVLEEEGVVTLAKYAITYKYGDLELDIPEIEVDNPELYEAHVDGLTARFTALKNGDPGYEVELDEGGFVLRCEEIR